MSGFHRAFLERHAPFVEYYAAAMAIGIVGTLTYFIGEIKGKEKGRITENARCIQILEQARDKFNPEKDSTSKYNHELYDSAADIIKYGGQHAEN